MDVAGVLQTLSGPLIGSVIGYGTNYIAIRMMFRPYYEKKIGNWTVPFTPGIIPRRQASIAKALGGAIGSELLTGDDIKKALAGERAEEAAVEMVLSLLDKEKETCIRTVLSGMTGEETYEELRRRIIDSICLKIIEGAKDLDLENLVVAEGGDALRKAMDGTMWAMFLSDKMLHSFAGPIVERLFVWLDTNGADLICPMLDKEIGNAEKMTVEALEEKLFPDREALKEKIRSAYRLLLEENNINELLQSFPVAEIVEEKINAMSVPEVEKLVFSIMKKELNAVVNLGAVIGFVLGLSQMFF